MSNHSWRLSVAIIMASGLIGCGQDWTKQGGTRAELEATKSSCENQSNSRFPPLIQPEVTSSGTTEPAATNCFSTGYGVNCVPTGGQSHPAAVDQNQAARNSAVRSCLMSNGWTPAKD